MSEVVTTIPTEAYAALGAVIASNLGIIIAFIKSLISTSAERAVIKENQNLILQTLKELKTEISKNRDDVNEAHARIRELKVQWQSKNIDV